MLVGRPKGNYKYVILVIALLAAAGVAYAYRPQRYAPIQTDNTPMALPNIPVPPGWYVLGSSSGTVDSMTFGDQPMNDSGNSTTTFIAVNIQDNFGKTDEQWIDSVLYPNLEQLESPTSTMLWKVVNGRLVLEAVIRTPAGGFDLDYYLFDDGFEYVFQLSSWRFDSSMLTDPPARMLQIMVQEFAEALPSSTVD
jgi:hypothetical protein